MIYSGLFSDIYHDLLSTVAFFSVDLVCRNEKILYELLNVELNIVMNETNIDIYSHELTKALPIKFTLAEFLTILTNNSDITHLCDMNKNITNYTSSTVKLDDGTNVYFALHYGTRLYTQLPNILKSLQEDKNTRQACASIWQSDELDFVNKSCNVFLQFIIRNDKLDLIVISRSSDLLTGLQIDAFHWQALLILFYNELKQTYNTLEIGQVVYKITSLHVYEKDKFIFDYLQKQKPQIEKYSQCLPLYQTFTELRAVAPRITSCETLNDICELYNFNIDQFEVIHHLQFIFAGRKHKLKR